MDLILIGKSEQKCRQLLLLLSGAKNRRKAHFESLSENAEEIVEVFS